MTFILYTQITIKLTLTLSMTWTSTLVNTVIVNVSRSKIAV